MTIPRSFLRIVTLVGSLVTSACGLGSVAPIVEDNDAVFDAELLGRWRDAAGKESVVITRNGSGYRLVYTDEDRRVGAFDARLGLLGKHRVLDLHPEEAPPKASDAYRSLVLRAHGLVLLDSTRAKLRTRLVRADSVRALLEREPHLVRHTMIGNAVLLTGSSAEVRTFLQTISARPGMLDEEVTWHRASLRGHANAGFPASLERR